MIDNFHWLGHDTFKITGDKIIYTDPYQIKTGDRADIILITHEHHDHCSPDDIRKIRGPQTAVVAPADCAAKIGGGVTVMKPGDAVEVKGIPVEAVPAYNTDKKFHTRDRGWMGYIFTLQGERIYLAGDTDHIPEMKKIKADIALLPVSGTYVMTAEEAASAALDIMPRIAVPMHYGSIVGAAEDARRFSDALRGKIRVVILPQE